MNKLLPKCGLLLIPLLSACAHQYGVMVLSANGPDRNEYTRTYYDSDNNPSKVVGEMKRVDGKLVYLHGLIPDAPSVLSKEEMASVQWTPR